MGTTPMHTGDLLYTIIKKCEKSFSRFCVLLCIHLSVSHLKSSTICQHLVLVSYFVNGASA